MATEFLAQRNYKNACTSEDIKHQLIMLAWGLEFVEGFLELFEKDLSYSTIKTNKR